MNEQDIERCEAFLKGTLPPAERDALEARLRDDAAFAQDFHAMRDAFDLVGVAGDARLKERLSVIHREVESDSGKVIPLNFKRWLAIAASVTLVIATGYWFFGRTPTTQELFAQYVSPYSAPDLIRSDDANAGDPWIRFGEAYSAQRYEEAIRELDAVNTASTPAYLLDFYRGQCLLLKPVADARGAIASFEHVLAIDNDLHAAAHWYTALAALKADDVATARTHMQELVNTRQYKQGEAARILELLPQP